MKNKELKKEMLKNGKYSELRKENSKLIKQGSSIGTEIYKKTLKNDNFLNLNNENITDIFGYKENKNQAINEQAKELNCSSDELISFRQLMHAKQQKRNRIEKDIKKAFESNKKLYFATLTFNDKPLEKTERKRREYVKNYLNQFDGYIANIDYGGKNGREHYHAIIIANEKTETEKIPNTKKFVTIKNTKEWQYGFSSIEKINTEEKDFKKVSNYIAKLTNHALKYGSHRILKKIPNYD